MVGRLLGRPTWLAVVIAGTALAAGRRRDRARRGQRSAGGRDGPAVRHGGTGRPGWRVSDVAPAAEPGRLAAGRDRFGLHPAGVGRELRAGRTGQWGFAARRAMGGVGLSVASGAGPGRRRRRVPAVFPGRPAAVTALATIRPAGRRVPGGGHPVVGVRQPGGGFRPRPAGHREPRRDRVSAAGGRGGPGGRPVGVVGVRGRRGDQPGAAVPAVG